MRIQKRRYKINTKLKQRRCWRKKKKKKVIKKKELEQEIQQLKQQLHDLPKKIVGEIKEWIKSQIIYCGGKASDVDILIAIASNQVFKDLQNILDTILKKYGGEDEQNIGKS